MTKVINEASLYGLTRIEISYVTNGQSTQDTIFSESFVEDSKKDLKNFENMS